MEIDKFVSLILREWAHINEAPASFAILTMTAFFLAYLAARWRYGGITESLKEQINTLNGRLIRKTEQSEEYKERALKFEETATKVITYDGAELCAKTLGLVARVREFIHRRKAQSYERLYRRSSSDANAEEEWEQSTDLMLRHSNETTAEWEREFKVDAMMLRDELLSRLGVTIDDRMTIMYEHPTNFFGYEDVASHLETLAKTLATSGSK